MESTDLTIEILKGIHSEMRGMRTEFRGMRESTEAFQERQEAFNERQEAFNGRQEAFNTAALQRFGAIQTALRDSAEQLIMQSRAIRVILDSRTQKDDRIDELDRRVTALETRSA